jgi:hypothetical protein
MARAFLFAGFFSGFYSHFPGRPGRLLRMWTGLLPAFSANYKVRQVKRE